MDLRSHAVRDDLADAALAHLIMVSRYATPVLRQCTAAIATICGKPGGNATSALLFGEYFEVFDFADGWAWGRCQHDSYVGYVLVESLGIAGAAPTHRVKVASALVFSEPDIKSPVRMQLPFGAGFAATSSDERFLTTDGGYIHLRHAQLTGEAFGDVFAAAEIFMNSPYLWGGRTPMGVDCSGLVQAALFAAGLPSPRDSDQQQQALGHPVAYAKRARGDLVFFPGHVGILASKDLLLHANAFWMRTVTEPLADVVARIGLSPHIRRI